MRQTIVRAVLTLATVGALAACSSGGSGSSPATDAGTTPAPAAAGGDALGYGAGSGATPAGASSLATASSSLGTIVVDGKGMTAYIFDKDTAGSGMSACSGQCATLWPAIEASSATPSVAGVTGTVGTITGTDGNLQVTLDGHPLYTYAADKAPGDDTGQGFGGVWWVVAPDGTPIGK